MKILFLSYWYPTGKDPVKGIFVREHAAAIRSAGNEIVVLAVTVAKGKIIFSKKEKKYIDESGIETHSLEIESIFYKFIYAIPPLLYYFTKQYFNKVICGSFKPEVIHANVISPCGVIGYWLAKKYKIPLVITEHWSKVQNFMSKNIFSGTAKRSYHYASYITVVSSFLKDRISPYVSDKNKIRIIPNVIDTSMFSYQKKIQNDKLIFIAIARWFPPKLPHYFIEALKKVQVGISKSIVLNIIGEGKLIELYKDNKTIPYKINFLGNQSKNKIAEALNESDFFLHSSDIETFSIVVAEALVSGVPVIVSNVGALPELVNDDNGILCNNTIDSWEKGIQQALQKNYDRKKISMESSIRFNKKKVGKLFTEMYREILFR